MIPVLFRCGHRGTFTDKKAAEAQAPICPECGERGISRSFAPNPSFVGTASGPFVEPKALDPAVVNLAETPLKLKEPDPDGA